MKVFCVIIISLIAVFVWIDATPLSNLVVPYYYNGKNEEIIEKGLKDWYFLKNVKFVRTEEQNLTTLKFVEVSSKQMYVNYRFGEYNLFTNTIKLNADKQLTKRQWIAIVSHEVGHYFLLQHTKDNTSIMSNGMYLNDEDKNQAMGNLGTVLLINKVRGWLDPLYPLICKKY